MRIENSLGLQGILGSDVVLEISAPHGAIPMRSHFRRQRLAEEALIRARAEAFVRAIARITIKAPTRQQ